MSNSLEYHVEEWALLALAQITGITALSFRHKSDEDAADDNCILASVTLGKRKLEGDRPYEGHLAIEMRLRQDVADSARLDYWRAVLAALAAPTSSTAAAYKAANFPRGFILHEEDCEQDKELWSENFRHTIRTIPFELEP